MQWNHNKIALVLFSIRFQETTFQSFCFTSQVSNNISTSQSLTNLIYIYAKVLIAEIYIPSYLFIVHFKLRFESKFDFKLNKTELKQLQLVIATMSVGMIRMVWWMKRKWFGSHWLSNAMLLI